MYYTVQNCGAQHSGFAEFLAGSAVPRELPILPLCDPDVRAHNGAYVVLRVAIGKNFGVKGGAKAGEKFIDASEFMSHLANIGDAKTLIIHPASTTHRQMSDEEQLKAGVTPDMVRMSVGIESLDDILWDIDQALSAKV